MLMALQWSRNPGSVTCNFSICNYLFLCNNKMKKLTSKKDAVINLDTWIYRICMTLMLSYDKAVGGACDDVHELECSFYHGIPLLTHLESVVPYQLGSHDPLRTPGLRDALVRGCACNALFVNSSDAIFDDLPWSISSLIFNCKLFLITIIVTQHVHHVTL